MCILKGFEQFVKKPGGITCVRCRLRVVDEATIEVLQYGITIAGCQALRVFAEFVNCVV